MVLLVLLWIFLALIGLISLIVLQPKSSVKEIIPGKSEKSVFTAEPPSGTIISPKLENNASLMSDSRNSEDAIDDDKCGVGQKESLSNENALYGMSGKKITEPLTYLEIDKFRSAIDYKSLDEKMKQAGILLGLNHYINDSFKKWAELELNIAVTGNSGTGKSSLINTLRKLKPSDEGAAAVDVIEATDLGTKYAYPENPNVALWDLPGIGTQTFTKEKYLDEMNFTRFDVVIIVSAGRFLENDIWLGQAVRALQKNVIFLRTKIYIDIMNDERDHPDTFNENECLEKIRQNLFDNIRDGGEENVVSGVYLVSSPKIALYDFDKFETTLKGMLNIKGVAIKTLLQRHIEGAIKAYQGSNKKEFTFRKIASVFYGFLPIPYLETGFGKLSLSSIRDICLKKFCMDEYSLDMMAKELETTKSHLKRQLKCYCTRDPEDSLTGCNEKNKWPSTVKRYSKYFVPIAGSFYSAYKSYQITDISLETITDEMTEDEWNLVNLRLKRLEEVFKRELPM